MLGLGSHHEIEYEYNRSIWWAFEDSPRVLKYALFFEDHLPSAGEKAFQELNVF